MMISKSMNAAINRQIGAEFAASLQYVAMASHFTEQNYPVLGAHFFKQADEEREHALRFAKFVLEAGGHIEIPAIASPATECLLKNYKITKRDEAICSDYPKSLVSLPLTSYKCPTPDYQNLLPVSKIRMNSAG